jgi:hypothetical protein
MTCLNVVFSLRICFVFQFAEIAAARSQKRRHINDVFTNSISHTLQRIGESLSVGFFFKAEESFECVEPIFESSLTEL